MAFPLAAAITGGLGLIGNLLGGKGKEQQYTSMESPEMQAWRRQYMSSLMGMMNSGPMGMGPTMGAYNNLLQRFYPQQQQMNIPALLGTYANGSYASRNPYANKSYRTDSQALG
jgi:hypothetical protein